MTLLDVVSDIDSFDEELCICLSRPWTIDSEVTVEPYPEDGLVRALKAVTGKDYFLEVFIARDFLQDLTGSQEYASLEAKCNRLIQYAENDA